MPGYICSVDKITRVFVVTRLTYAFEMYETTGQHFYLNSLNVRINIHELLCTHVLIFV